MFRRRRFRRFRARRRGGRSFTNLLEKRTNYVEIEAVSIASAANDTFSLLTGADAVTNNVSDDSTVADCEKGSKIIGGKVHVLLTKQSGTGVTPISWALYKDAYFSAMTDLTDISNVLQPSTTMTIGAQKKFTVAKGKFVFTPNTDKTRFVIGSRLFRKIGKLREGEAVKLFVQNHNASGNPIQVDMYGNIRTIK